MGADHRTTYGMPRDGPETVVLGVRTLVGPTRMRPASDREAFAAGGLGLPADNLQSFNL